MNQQLKNAKKRLRKLFPDTSAGMAKLHWAVAYTMAEAYRDMSGMRDWAELFLGGIKPVDEYSFDDCFDELFGALADDDDEAETKEGIKEVFDNLKRF